MCISSTVLLCYKIAVQLLGFFDCVLNEVLYWTSSPSFLLPLLFCRDMNRKSEATGRVGVASAETKQDVTSVP